jgi:RNA polymerase sigma-70 factor (ECF subfamily)
MCRRQNTPGPSQVFRDLLTQSHGGNKEALDQLVPLVYKELHALASRLLRAERSDHTLRPTALIHEAYLRLAAGDAGWQERTHFFALSGRIMRQILVDYARSHRAAKRGGNAGRVALDEGIAIVPEQLGDVIVVDDALERLAQTDPRKSQVIELIYFGGLSYAEAATVLGISEATLHRDLAFARSWLRRELTVSDQQQN